MSRSWDCRSKQEVPDPEAPRSARRGEEPGGREVLFPEVNGSGAQRGGASHSHTSGVASPSASPAAGKYGDSSKSLFVQPLYKYPLCRLRPAEETAPQRGSEMIIGGSVLLGPAFINVPINFTCPALFCFH